MRHSKKDAPISQTDSEFLDDFIIRYDKLILYIAGKYAGKGILAEDIRQEALIRLMGNVPKLRTLTHNKTCTYISKTVQTAFIDLERKEKRHFHVSMDAVLEEIVGMEIDLVPDLFLSQELQRLRKHLSAREWLVLKGKYIFGFSHEELGKQLEMEPDSVRMILSRARKHSRQILSCEKVAGGDGND